MPFAGSMRIREPLLEWTPADLTVGRRRWDRSTRRSPTGFVLRAGRRRVSRSLVAGSILCNVPSKIKDLNGRVRNRAQRATGRRILTRSRECVCPLETGCTPLAASHRCRGPAPASLGPQWRSWYSMAGRPSVLMSSIPRPAASDENQDESDTR